MWKNSRRVMRYTEKFDWIKYGLRSRLHVRPVTQKVWFRINCVTISGTAVTEGGVFAFALPVHGCLSAWSDRQPYCHTNAMSCPCWGTTKFCATMASQDLVGASGRCDIAMQISLPPVCLPLLNRPNCFNTMKKAILMGICLIFGRQIPLNLRTLKVPTP